MSLVFKCATLAFWGMSVFGQRLSDFVTPVPITPGSPLVIGFLGGWEPWEGPHRNVRKLALRLRSEGIQTEWAENHRRGVMMKFVERALDSNRDGHLDPQECRQARLVLYGQSFGGGAVVLFARELEKRGIPVLLTVQVDSVGARDAVIPPNVRAAANFFQHDWLTIQGQREIRAADPSRTTIIGNFQFQYMGREVDTTDASWMRRTFGGSHAKMELDPELWSEVGRLIRESISRPRPR